MTVFEKIKGLLDKANISYDVIEHEPVHTSEEAARIRDTALSDGAKALVMLGDKKPLLLVVPGDKKVDFKTVKKALKVKDLRMATPDEVEKLTTLKIGSIPPVGKAIDLPSYYDESFIEKEKATFNAGSLTTSIEMKAKDLIDVEGPTILKMVV